MENKDRDKLNRTPQSTETGDLNRQTPKVDKDKNDTSADFGQNIGRSENLNDPNQKSGNTWDESSGRNSGSGSMKGSGSSTTDLDRDRDSSMGSNTGSDKTSGSDTGRH